MTQPSIRLFDGFAGVHWQRQTLAQAPLIVDGELVG